MDKEDKEKIEDIEKRVMAGEAIPSEDVSFLLTELTQLELSLINADILAMTVDVTVDRGGLDPRTLIYDARIIYGEYWKYEHAKPEDLLRFHGGIHEVREHYSEKSEQ